MPHEKQLPISNPMGNLPPPPNSFVNPPPFLPPRQLVNPQLFVIPSSIPARTAIYLPVPNIPQQNIVQSPQFRLVPCPTEPKFPLNRNPDLNLWRFPQNTPPPSKANEVANDAAVFYNFPTTFPSSTANPASSHAISQWTAPKNVNSNHAATCSKQVNPFSTATNIHPPFVTPIIPPMYGNTAPAPLCWVGPQHPTPPVPAAKNANLIKSLADAITSKRSDPLPEWKLSQYNGDLLQWYEWYGQFKSKIDSQSLTDDVNLTYFKTLVTGKAKTAIAEFAFCSAMYKDELRTRERNFGQPQAVVSAHLDKLNSSPPLKMHKIDNIINYSGCI